MSRNSRFSIVVLAALAFLIVYVSYELVSSAATSSATVQLVASRTRVKPGETIQFSLKLVDSRGRSQSIPRSGQPPQLVLTDSQGRQVGKFSFRFG